MKQALFENLNTYWNQSFPGMSPLAHEFKERYKDRWVRFHSLPKSKRYAETEEEMAIVLERHNAVLENLNQARASSLILLTSEWTWDTNMLLQHSDEKLCELDSKAVLWRSWRVEESSTDDMIYHHVFASEWLWQKAVFDPILRLVANDKVGNVMIMDTSKQWLYHPYDGGADIVLASSEERDILRDKYKTWLSNHPLGY